MIKKLKFKPEYYLITSSRKYSINGVNYIVSSTFDENQPMDIKRRFENCISKSVTPLTKNLHGSKLTKDYVTLTAGKED